MVSWAKLGADRVTYYEHSVAAGKEHYYAGAGEAQGRYAGDGARLLGLAGELRDGELTRLAAGLHPVTGERLRETAGAKSGTEIGAFDFTFSVPKSVSLLYASGDRELSARILDAHDRAVEASLRVLEQEAAFVRRGKGGAIRERVNGFIVASYRHRTSRAGDPQLHQHAIVANMARGPDGRWTALDSVRARDFKMALGAIHEAELRANIAELGLEWKPLDRKGSPSWNASTNRSSASSQRAAPRSSRRRSGHGTARGRWPERRSAHVASSGKSTCRLSARSQTRSGHGCWPQFASTLLSVTHGNR